MEFIASMNNRLHHSNNAISTMIEHLESLENDLDSATFNALRH